MLDRAGDGLGAIRVSRRHRLGGTRAASSLLTGLPLDRAGNGLSLGGQPRSAFRVTAATASATRERTPCSYLRSSGQRFQLRRPAMYRGPGQPLSPPRRSRERNRPPGRVLDRAGDGFGAIRVSRRYHLGYPRQRTRPSERLLDRAGDGLGVVRVQPPATAWATLPAHSTARTRPRSSEQRLRPRRPATRRVPGQPRRPRGRPQSGRLPCPGR